MRHSIRFIIVLAVTWSVIYGFGEFSLADVERAAIAARQDELQNITVDCHEMRAYDIDPAVAAMESPNFRQVPIDLKRAESSNLTFKFRNGNARYDRQTDGNTLNYWNNKGLPAIAHQTQLISATGRIEELTTQLLANGKRASFGGFRQLTGFAPDDTIDIALGLRLLGGRQWLTKDDLNAMEEIQSDPAFIVLHTLDGSGHLHEMRFDKRLLYAMSYYRCTGTRGSYVEIINSDFHRYGNVFIPGKMIRTSNVINTSGQMHHPLTFILTLKTASLGDPNNDASGYAINWPSHLKLFDARTNDQIEVGPTTRPFSDDDIRQQLAERRTREIMLQGIAAERIKAVLGSQPTTMP